jgi:hypothetical protein
VLLPAAHGLQREAQEHSGIGTRVRIDHSGVLVSTEQWVSSACVSCTHLSPIGPCSPSLLLVMLLLQLLLLLFSKANYAAEIVVR